MNDLIAAFLKEVLGYVPVLASVVASPRQTIPHRIYDRNAPLKDAMTFFGATLALLLVLQAPLVGSEHDYIKVAGPLLAIKIVTMLVFAASITFLFRVAGGHGGFIATLCASLYIVAPVYLFTVTLKLLGLGILTTGHPAETADLKAGALSFEQTMHLLTSEGSGTAMLITGLMLVYMIGVIGWYLVCWRIYRQIHDVSRLRSGLIYLVTWLLYAGTVHLDRFMQHAIFDGKPPPVF